MNSMPVRKNSVLYQGVADVKMVSFEPGPYGHAKFAYVVGFSRTPVAVYWNGVSFEVNGGMLDKGEKYLTPDCLN